MRKLTAIYLCFVLSLIALTATSGCGASGDGGCGGSSRAFHPVENMSRAAKSRGINWNPPRIVATNFVFSDRVFLGNRFKATSEISGVPQAIHIVEEPSDPDFASRGQGERIGVSSYQAPCDSEPDWTIGLDVYDYRTASGGRLQANHAYPIRSDSSTAADKAVARIYGSKGAGGFIAQAGSVTVESVDDHQISLRLVDLLFVHVGKDQQPDDHGWFKLNGTISLAKQPWDTGTGSL